MDSDSTNHNNNMNDIMTMHKKKLRKLLECPVCKEISIPPIFFCKNGHHICDKCRKSFKTCSTCRTNILETRNIFLEHVFQLCEFSCIYKDEGCKLTLSVTNLKIHQEQCDFRPIKCEMCDIVGNNVNISYSKYLEHIATGHGNIYQIIHYDNGKAVLKFKFHPKYFQEFKPDGIEYWGQDIVKFEGYTFIIMTAIESSLVGVWVSLFGNEVEANNFYVKIFTGNSILNPNTKLGIDFQGEVHSFRTTWEELKKRGSYLNASFPFIQAVWDELPNRCVWTATVQIIKRSKINDLTV